MSHSKEGTHSRAVQRALEYAESGMDAAQQEIRLPGPVPEGLSQPLVNGGMEYSIAQDTNTPQQLDVYATGYYDLPQGAFEDPITHAHAQRAVVHARIYFDNVDKALIAVPGKLKVNPGAFVNDAVYAADLVFVKGGDAEAPTHVQSAFYSHSITREDGTADSYPSYVVFGSTPVLLGYPLHFPRLAAPARAYYKQFASSFASQLSDGSDLDGVVPAPPLTAPASLSSQSAQNVPVYYCEGDLDVGNNGVFNPSGSFIVYVTGNLRIHNSIGSNGSSWVVFLVEKDIEIHSDAIGNLMLNGTFIANGKIMAMGSERQAS